MTLNERVPKDSFAMAHESYLRCGAADAFYSSFYRRLLASHPSIPPRFAKTDFTRQHKVLQHALGLLLAFGQPGNGKILDRIAERHTKANLDVPPSLYPLFVESLIATLREFDPLFSPELEQAWRRSIAPGIAYLAASYDTSVDR